MTSIQPPTPSLTLPLEGEGNAMSSTQRSTPSLTLPPQGRGEFFLTSGF